MNVRELEVLDILYSSSAPMTSSQITRARYEMTQSTVTTVLRKLLRFGIVEIVGNTYSGKVLSRTYRPTDKAKQVLLEYFLKEYSRIQNALTLDEIYTFIQEHYVN